MISDIQIAQGTELLPIADIAARIGIPPDALLPYGRYKAKIDTSCLPQTENTGKLILVTAMTPTPAGEGKTTVSIGLADGLARFGKRTALALREPSLGPVFGVKGGAAGGGYAQVVPMEEINLHFTGDFHAIGSANNLLAAMLDNHIQQGNALGIDPRRIVWKRCMDMNDRQLRNIVSGLGGKANGTPREDGFEITVASEVMAVLCLSANLQDLQERLSRMVVAYTYGDVPVTAGDLQAAGAMAALLKDAILPNLVQTLEGTPAFIHGGPFANIAHGCNSAIATKTALQLSEYTVTEAGFGSDLGAEKFLDIKCRMHGLIPAAVVLVASVRALKMHGGVAKKALAAENVSAVREGIPNLLRHAENLRDVFGLNVVVAVNRFTDDTDAELTAVTSALRAEGFACELAEVWAQGGAGGQALAKAVLTACERPTQLQHAYPVDASIDEKLRLLTRRVYHGEDVILSDTAKKQAKRLTAAGYGNLPVCVAKTQYSFSDNAALLCAPENFSLSVRSLKLCAGAGFITAITGDIMTMPGLPKNPAAEKIGIDPWGRITGLF